MLRSIGVLCAAALALAGLSVPAQADNDPADGRSLPEESGRVQAQGETPRVDDSSTAEVPSERRAEVLGKGWAASKDRAWTLSGDRSGLHLLVADAKDGYRWRTAATLSELGFETDRWIGSACITTGGTKAVVAYAPRSFVNRPHLAERGAFAAVVNLESGKVTKLAQQVSLAHFSPSCGHASQALFTQEGGQEKGQTRLVSVDAARERVVRTVTVEGQMTSAVPTRVGVVAAEGGRIVAISSTGAKRTLAKTDAVAHSLAADAEGGVTYIDHQGEEASVRRLPAQRLAVVGNTSAPAALARGHVQTLGLGRAANGSVVIMGEQEAVGQRPRFMRSVSAASPTMRVSTHAELLVDVPVTDALPPAGDVTVEQRSLTMDATSVTTKKATSFRTIPIAAKTKNTEEPSPALKGSGARKRNKSADQPTCAVPRNDPGSMAMQPKPRQVEWAVNQAIQGVLNVERPANWKNLGMPSYTPQGLFPLKELRGGGEVPAQVMLGVLAQESNMWQAPGSSVPGVPGNPLIGNYYGLELYNDTPNDDWDINFADADCGYGVAQVTDGMRKAGSERPGETALPYQTQRAVALDYAANVAAGLNILIDKWNQVHDAGLTINNGDPDKIENWFYAVWAYNSGLHPKGEDPNGNWGLGWFNNPANPRYPTNRAPFLDGNSYGDAAHPQDWPYPEKVMGWAAWPPSLLEGPNKLVPGYRAAWWNGRDENDPETGKTANQNRREVKPPLTTFCDDSNNCTPEQACPAQDASCWFHKSVTWKEDCSYSCGNSFIRFPTGWEYQQDADSYAPNCSGNGIPAGSWVVDDTPPNYASKRDEPCRSPASTGTFTIAHNTSQGQIDLHQLGAGFGDHLYYTHTRNKRLRDNAMETIGTWSFDRVRIGWGRILVHIPDVAAHTQQAHYTVDTGRGKKTRVMLQRIRTNEWRSLGVFKFSGAPKVSLTSVTPGGDGPDKHGQMPERLHHQDVAWDAVALQPLERKPDAIVVSMGDSYSSGEGLGSLSDKDKGYFPETNVRLDSVDPGDDERRLDKFESNFCHRAKGAWSRQLSVGPYVPHLGDRHDFRDNAEHSFLACSGAETNNILPTASESIVNADNSDKDPFIPVHGQWGEVSQMDKGFLDEETTLVTLSIGGNDLGFGTIITSCITTWDCSSSPEANAAIQAGRNRLNRTLPELLKEIRKRATNARIAIVGYPQLFEPGVSFLPGCDLIVTAAERQWIAELGLELNGLIRSYVDEAGAGFEFVDPSEEFRGHGLCSIFPYINAVRLRDHGDSLDPPLEWWDNRNSGMSFSFESFHPNKEGAAAYSKAVSSRLN